MRLNEQANWTKNGASRIQSNMFELLRRSLFYIKRVHKMTKRKNTDIKNFTVVIYRTDLKLFSLADSWLRFSGSKNRITSVFYFSRNIPQKPLRKRYVFACFQLHWLWLPNSCELNSNVNHFGCQCHWRWFSRWMRPRACWMNLLKLHVCGILLGERCVFLVL